ncbi:MAG: hypothetical protein ABI741_13540 [Ferruginibacter sp.]
MKAVKISEADHFLHESQAWCRALDFYLQENAYLKTRLSHVLDNNIDKEFVDLAEYFQSNFIHVDENIKGLQKDILLLQRYLKGNPEGMTMDEKSMIRQQNKLRNEMGFFEKEFTQQKNKFDQYLISLMH